MSKTASELAMGLVEEDRAKRLKAATHAAHERLDKRIMAYKPFADSDRYGRFLQVQYEFHRDIAALYEDPDLQAALPDLEIRRRWDLIGQDIADLGRRVDMPQTMPEFEPEAIDFATALGWLYVAEGSNLGAAFLYKAAMTLGFDSERGARHLAGHPDGRAQHWRKFTAALDDINLSEAEEQRAFEGAKSAFSRVYQLVEDQFGQA